MPETGAEDQVATMTLEPEQPEREEAPPRPEGDPESGPASGPGSEPVREPGSEEIASELTDDDLARQVAALIFASPEPLSPARLAALLGDPSPARIEAALATLERRLEQAGLPLRVAGLRGGHTLMTTPDVAPALARLAKGNPVERISPASLETLAVIAYRQPVTKAEIEAIRGVQAGPILRSLVDRGLARVLGRADLPGRPLQYGTSKEFLDRFGLMSLKDLPRDSELARD